MAPDSGEEARLVLAPAEPMGRKASKAVGRKASAPKPDDTERKPMAVQMRAAPEWKACLERLAALDGRSVASLIDRAVRAYGRQIGFTEEFPER